METPRGSNSEQLVQLLDNLRDKINTTDVDTPLRLFIQAVVKDVNNVWVRFFLVSYIWLMVSTPSQFAYATYRQQTRIRLNTAVVSMKNTTITGLDRLYNDALLTQWAQFATASRRPVLNTAAILSLIQYVKNNQTQCLSYLTTFNIQAVSSANDIPSQKIADNIRDTNRMRAGAPTSAAATPTQGNTILDGATSTETIIGELVRNIQQFYLRAEVLVWYLYMKSNVNTAMLYLRLPAWKMLIWLNGARITPLRLTYENIMLSKEIKGVFKAEDGQVVIAHYKTTGKMEWIKPVEVKRILDQHEPPQSTSSSATTVATDASRSEQVPTVEVDSSITPTINPLEKKRAQRTIILPTGERYVIKHVSNGLYDILETGRGYRCNWSPGVTGMKPTLILRDPLVPYTLVSVLMTLMNR